MMTLDDNVDPRELKKFTAVSSRWWDPEGELKTLHDINPLRLDYIDRLANLPGKRVLDVGCGGGILAEGMAGRQAQVTAIDAAEEPLNVARMHLEESGLEVNYLCSTPEALAQQQEAQFDIVTCMEMLEHVPEPRRVIESCAHLCKPGGHLFFSTINRNAKAYILAIVGAEYLLSMLPKGTHEFHRFIRPAELVGWLRTNNITATDLTGLTYNPLTRRYALGNDIDVNYLVHAHKER